MTIERSTTTTTAVSTTIIPATTQPETTSTDFATEQPFVTETVASTTTTAVVIIVTDTTVPTTTTAASSEAAKIIDRNSGRGFYSYLSSRSNKIFDWRKKIWRWLILVSTGISSNGAFLIFDLVKFKEISNFSCYY